MCLGMLKGEQWKPSSKIAAVLEAAKQLLNEPLPDDAVETGAAELYKNNRAEFDKKAREWTKQYAK
jgi:ubiquitin-protein ligase